MRLVTDSSIENEDSSIVKSWFYIGDTLDLKTKAKALGGTYMYSGEYVYITKATICPWFLGLNYVYILTGAGTDEMTFSFIQQDRWFESRRSSRNSLQKRFFKCIIVLYGPLLEWFSSEKWWNPQ